MSFSTNIFIFVFCPIILLLYALYRDARIRNLIVLVASVVFYAWGGVDDLAAVLLLVLISWLFGLAVKDRKWLLIVAVVMNLIVLGVYKYAAFACEILGQFVSIGEGTQHTLTSIAQPIGISFLTFSIISYLVDVCRGKVVAVKNPLLYAEYVLMFPKVMSGPIVRYSDIATEMTDRVSGIEQYHAGLQRFMMGFIKKVLVANQIAVVADAAFNYEWALHPMYAWIGALSYTLYIYLDFSSYSDMAIGLAEFLGFHFKENFNYPYIAVGIQDFWRRWHISLSTWFRDYVYIPLGGNRKGEARTYLNQTIVFFLTGLWHGANWTFIAWGLYHGIFLLIEKATGFCVKIPKWLVHIYTLMVVLFGWVLFRADNIHNALLYIGYMFGAGNGSIQNVTMVEALNTQYIVAAIAGLVLSMPLVGNAVKRIRQEWIVDIVTLLLFFVAICYMMASDYNPFIYFRF